MSAKINVQQKVDKKIYNHFRSILMRDGISIQKGLEAAMELYIEKDNKKKEKT